LRTGEAWQKGCAADKRGFGYVIERVMTFCSDTLIDHFVLVAVRRFDGTNKSDFNKLVILNIIPI
jgi:hypothetical protein